MAKPGQKDNSTYRQKVALRLMVLKRARALGEPVVLETHGGYGKIGDVVYADVARGVVFEKEEARCEVLAVKRPGWSVFQADSTKALQAGAGGFVAPTILDLDPYWDPWPTILAFFTSRRAFAPRMWVVVQDGLRNKARISPTTSSTLAPMVPRFGNKLYRQYLETCAELMRDAASRAGYDVEHFAGYYTGANQGMTHYAALLGGRPE